MKDNALIFFISLSVSLYVGRVTITVENAYLTVGTFLFMFSLVMFVKYGVVKKLK